MAFLGIKRMLLNYLMSDGYHGRACTCKNNAYVAGNLDMDGRCRSGYIENKDQKSIDAKNGLIMESLRLQKRMEMFMTQSRVDYTDSLNYN